MTKLYTVGYQGQTVDAVVSYLQTTSIALLIDVRQVPLSRKPGFSKRALAGNLAAAGIDYTHVVALGTPTELRAQVRKNKDYATFLNAYRAYLQTQELALHATLPLIYEHSSCLLCFEQNPNECHRSVVAEQLARVAASEGRELEIVNL